MLGLRIPIDPGVNVPKFSGRRIDKPMAKSYVARRRDSQQPKTCAARIRLAHSLVQLLKRVVDV